MKLHKCPFCSSESVGIINILNINYTVGCSGCGMTGPIGETEEQAKSFWEGLCHNMCHHCISRPWGKALLKRVKKLSESIEEEN